MAKRMVWAQSASTFTVPITQLAGSSIDLDFADAQYFGSTPSLLLSCSRAYGGFVTDANGTIFWCSANTLRIGTGTGLLIEQASTNLLFPSDGSGWSAVVGATGTCVITPNYTTGPDSSNEATRLQMSNNSDFALAQIVNAGTYSTGGYVGSVYMKSNTASYYSIGLFNDTGTQTSVTVTPAWQRFAVTEFLQAGAVLKFHVFPGDSNAVDISVFGPQIEFQRANLVTPVGWGPVVGATGTCVITNNFAAAPDGTVTATRLQMSPNSDYAIAQQLYAQTGLSSLYTGSIWLKSNTASNYSVLIFDDRGTMANVTATPTWQQFTLLENVWPNPFKFQVDATVNGTDILVWGEMITAEPTFATSYIRTLTTPLGRDADVINLISTAATILNGAAVSFAVRIAPLADGGIVVFEHVGNDGAVLGLYNGAFGIYNVNTSNGVTNLGQTVPANYWGAIRTFTAGFDNTGRTIAADNASTSDAVNVTAGFLTQLVPSGQVYLKRLTLWNSRLSDATLKTLTMM